MAQTILITGGSRGIGAATARLCARNGWHVALNYHRSRAAAQALVDELTAEGHTAVAIGADVSDPAAAQRMVEEAEGVLGALDALVCNAGVSHVGLLTDCSDADWRRVMGVNLDGVFYAMRAAIPAMVRRQRGSIVTVSSMWGVTGGSCESIYSAAKAGVIGLTRAAAKELAPSHIRVNCVAPGVVDTEMNGALDADTLAALCDETPLGRLGTAEDIAQSILFLCSEQSSFFTGQLLQPNGGIVI